MIDAGDSQVILYWPKNHPENHYLIIAILLMASAVAMAASSLNDLKIQLWSTLLHHVFFYVFPHMFSHISSPCRVLKTCGALISPHFT